MLGPVKERHLDAHLDLSFRLSIRWYLGFPLNEPLPDHSSLTRIRDRYGLEIFRRFFDAIVEQCEQAGLVWGKQLYVDSTKVLANASVGSMAPRFAVEAHLETLFGSQSQEAESQSEPGAEDQAPPTMLPTGLAEDPSEHLAEANRQRHDWIAEAGKQNRAEVAHDYQRIADFEAGTTDPDASRVPSG